ncbi:tail fiber domain-containing protein [Klebsiella aerogenes]|nr:tail fiber domain-containing protein [Klebsiella aerogenes]
MSAGTLVLSNNDVAVTGSGTSFTTELAAGDFIVVIVGGVPYTLPVKSVESDTGLTLVSVYTGPTQSGAAWSAVPRVALNMVTAALVAQSAEALRGLNYDKQNWQQIFSGSGDITVTLPDGSSWNGPAWNTLKTSLNNKAEKTELDKKADKTDLDQKANKTDLDKKADKAGGIKLSKGTATSRSAIVIDDTWWQGSAGDGLIYSGQIEFRGNSTGPLFSWNVLQEKVNNYVAHVIRVKGWGTDDGWYYFHATGDAYGGSWKSSSDQRIKKNKKLLENPLEKIIKLNGYSSYEVKSNPSQKNSSFRMDCGLLAQEVKAVLPEAVNAFSDGYDADGNEIVDILALNYSGMSALYVESIKALIHLLNMSLDDPDAARAKIEEILSGS